MSIISVLLLSVFVTANAQRPDRMYEYNFKAAVVEYNDSLSSGCDSLKYTEAVKKAENGVEMSRYCHRPKVVAKKRFHISDFFLFYPMNGKTWHPTQRPGMFLCAPESIPDTVRVPVADSLLLFPVISGNEKYFSSKDLYGVGGYDIYVSRWNEKKKAWGPPENLGFPYSSPYDDYLFVNSEDGRYSIFASNRECPEDSVNVYVVEYESVMVREEISDPARLEALCSLAPCSVVKLGDEAQAGGAVKTPDESTRKYMEKISHIKRLRDTLAANSKSLSMYRDAYASAASADKGELAKKINVSEQKEAVLRQKVEKESKELRDIEMDFLMNGIAIDINKLIEESDQVKMLSETGFTFTRQAPGKSVYLEYVK